MKATIVISQDSSNAYWLIIDRATGRFSEVVLIRTPKDLEAFRREFRITEPIKTIY